ncbi:MAG: thioesterase II family protein [Leptolyngbyaceae cyanobacterium]
MVSWLNCAYPKSTATVRLFCFPYAGGGAWIYRNWGQALPESVEVYSVELPGHGQRLTEEPLTQLDALIASLANAMKPYLNKPFACFGHSLGGLIAFELIKYLHRDTQIYPFNFWISATRAPHVSNPNPLIHTLPDNDLIDEIRRYNGTPAKILENPEFMKLLLPALRADFTILETYSYREHPPLPCPVTAFWGEKDTITSESEVVAWRQHTSNKFSTQGFAGDHFFVHTQKVLETLISYFSRLPSLRNMHGDKLTL